MPKIFLCCITINKWLMLWMSNHWQKYTCIKITPCSFLPSWLVNCHQKTWKNSGKSEGSVCLTSDQNQPPHKIRDLLVRFWTHFFSLLVWPNAIPPVTLLGLTCAMLLTLLTFCTLFISVLFSSGHSSHGLLLTISLPYVEVWVMFLAGTFCQVHLPILLALPSLIPKQWHHSFRAMSLSRSPSHSWKKRVMQCSMGTREALKGASSECVNNLKERAGMESCIALKNQQDYQSWSKVLEDSNDGFFRDAPVDFVMVLL